MTICLVFCYGSSLRVTPQATCDHILPSDPATRRARTRPRPRIRLEASLGTFEGGWFSLPIQQSFTPDIINKALQFLIAEPLQISQISQSTLISGGTPLRLAQFY